ncbi:hypothetical protein LTR37_017461 [Vermiconidia calcicola]|uniref:Uncharacterized protein n=1 Tax=Vermiconidia calcicola TaxID=1690605 RepID=A0ACC3MK65_9PEZI|nr:hypothetical protein LTR37_017461 [Vermiconidia calcicola]
MSNSGPGNQESDNSRRTGRQPNVNRSGASSGVSGVVPSIEQHRSIEVDPTARTGEVTLGNGRPTRSPVTSVASEAAPHQTTSLDRGRPLSRERQSNRDEPSSDTPAASRVITLATILQRTITTLVDMLEMQGESTEAGRNAVQELRERLDELRELIGDGE